MGNAPHLHVPRVTLTRGEKLQIVQKELDWERRHPMTMPRPSLASRIVDALKNAEDALDG